MEPDSAMLDAVVVGAGPAGLGVSHALLERGLRHRVVERGRIGETWRSQRWDSFRMNTPNALTVMPGDRYGGADPEGFMTRDEFVALLEDFAGRHGLPVETDNPVTELALDAAGGGYRLETGRGRLRARNVVIASGSLKRPRRPAAASRGRRTASPPSPASTSPGSTSPPRAARAPCWPSPARRSSSPSASPYVGLLLSASSPDGIEDRRVEIDAGHRIGTHRNNASTYAMRQGSLWVDADAAPPDCSAPL